MASTPDTLGHYKVQRVLGQGAMGVVYEGFDARLHRRVAIKTIQKADFGDWSAREFSSRFLREAQAVARLNHPNIVQVYDFGEDEKRAFIVMEFIDGKDLKTHFEQSGRFELRNALRIMCQLLDALDFAHQAGVVHRDIKPANVMLDGQSRTKLTDFGVARFTDEDRAGIDSTQVGTIVGTPAYMSPEQVLGQKIDGRSDIFSAGVLLYEFLTGKKPFEGGAFTLAKMIIEADPPPPSSLERSIAPELDQIITRTMAKNPDHRFATAREAAAAIRSYMTRGSLPAFDDDSTVLGPGAVTSGKHPPFPRPDEPSKPVARIQQGQPQSSEADLEFWRSIRDSDDHEDLELYVRRFPDGIYVGLAKRKMAKLRRIGPGSTEEDSGLRSGKFDEEYWRSIKDSEDPDDWELYLTKFPEGTFAELAKRRLAKLRRGISDTGGLGSAARSRPDPRTPGLKPDPYVTSSEAAWRARRTAEDEARRDVEWRSEEQAHRVAEEATRDALLRQEAEANRPREVEARSKREAEEISRREAEEIARREVAELDARELARQQGETAQQEAEQKTRREAEAKAQREAEERARREAEEAATREETAKREAAALAARELHRQQAEIAKQEAEEMARHEAQANAKREAEEMATREAAALAALEVAHQQAEAARQEAEQRARREAESKAQREAEEKARREAEEAARREAEEKAGREAAALAALALARQKAEAAKREAEEKARREAEAEREAEEAAKRAAEAKARHEGEERVKREEQELAKRQAKESAARELGRRQAEAAKLAAEETARRDAQARANREPARVRRDIDDEDRVPQQQPERATRRPLLVGVVLVALAAGAGGVYFAMQKPAHLTVEQPAPQPRQPTATDKLEQPIGKAAVAPIPKSDSESPANAPAPEKPEIVTVPRLPGQTPEPTARADDRLKRDSDKKRREAEEKSTREAAADKAKRDVEQQQALDARRAQTERANREAEQRQNASELAKREAEEAARDSEKRKVQEELRRVQAELRARTEDLNRQKLEADRQKADTERPKSEAEKPRLRIVVPPAM